MPSVEKKQASSLSSKSPQHVPQLRNSSAIAEELSQRSHYRLYVKRKQYPLRALRLSVRQIAAWRSLGANGASKQAELFADFAPLRELKGAFVDTIQRLSMRQELPEKFYLRLLIYGLLK